MKKSILNLEGAQELTRKQQKSINGGGQACNSTYPCTTPGECCKGGNGYGGICMSITGTSGQCIRQIEPNLDL